MEVFISGGDEDDVDEKENDLPFEPCACRPADSDGKCG